MKEWYLIRDIAGLVGMPKSQQGVSKKSKSESWKSQPKLKGKGNEYHISSFPEATRQHLLEQDNSFQAGRSEATTLYMKESLKSMAVLTQNQNQMINLSGVENARLGYRLAIVEAWLVFTRKCGKTKTETAYQFASLYNEKAIDFPTEILGSVSSISARSLIRWEAQIKKEGTARLGGKYGNRKGQSKIDQSEFLKQYIIGFIYDYPHADTTHVYNALNARFSSDKSIEIPSKRSVQRWVANWKDENAQILTAVSNPDEWKNKFMVAHGSLSDGIERMNQVWELDSTPGDILLTDGRYALVGIIDVYTRRLKMIVSRTSKATAVAGILRRCLIDWGVPEIAKTDNGADYVGFHIRRSLIDLGIEQVLCPPFQPWHKPHIERSFKTFSHDLLELMPGFCGHNVAEKASLQARQSFADRLFKKNEVIEMNMTSQQLQKFCDDWCENIYSHQQHSGLDGKTPFQMVTEYTGEVEVIESERALDILLAEAPQNHGRRTVQKKGIRIKWQGEPSSHWYSSPELGLYVNKELRVNYDPAGEMGQVFVFGDQGFICVAECPELLGLNRKEHAVAAKQIQQRYVNEGRKAMKAAAKQANTKSAADEILIDAARNTHNVTMLPKPTNTYTSVGLEAAEAAVEAENQVTTPSSVSDETRKKLDAEIVAQKTIEKLPETRQQRYLRWSALQRSVEAEITLSKGDHTFWQGYRDTPEWKSQRVMEEDFGLTDSLKR